MYVCIYIQYLLTTDTSHRLLTNLFRKGTHMITLTHWNKQHDTVSLHLRVSSHRATSLREKHCIYVRQRAVSVHELFTGQPTSTPA